MIIIAKKNFTKKLRKPTTYTYTYVCTYTYFKQSKLKQFSIVARRDRHSNEVCIKRFMINHLIIIKETRNYSINSTRSLFTI